MLSFQARIFYLDIGELLLSEVNTVNMNSLSSHSWADDTMYLTFCMYSMLHKLGVLPDKE
jgi:hypothetical protein